MFGGETQPSGAVRMTAIRGRRTWRQRVTLAVRSLWRFARW